MDAKTNPLFQQKWQDLPTVLQQYCQMGKCFTLLITALVITILCILPSPHPPSISSHDQMAHFLDRGSTQYCHEGPAAFLSVRQSMALLLKSGNNRNMLLSRHKGDPPLDTVSRIDIHLATGEGSKDCPTLLLACFPWQPNAGPGLRTECVTLEWVIFSVKALRRKLKYQNWKRP